ncbi:MAG: aldo/keto reductase [Planctomycetota bacterium]|nr:aldo/keto reductase [Planctomycetota bacterium]
MSDQQISRREFVQSTAVAAAALAAGAGFHTIARAEDLPDIKRTRSYNPDMEYRRLGKTNAWVSAVCMGGHWKRVDTAIKGSQKVEYSQPTGDEKIRFAQNRHDIVSCCIDHGINLIDACTGGEVMAYAAALKGRRDKMFLNYSWYEKEMRFAEWRSTPKLLQSLDEGLKEAGLEYVDLWRITCHEKGSSHTEAETEGFIKALESARKAGKCRFTGISTHDRPWIKKMVEKYGEALQVIVTPYTADSKVLPTDSVFEAVKKCDVGVLGIKPFASNSLFKGSSRLDDPNAAEDDKRARLAIRYILCNPAITAPIPGLINQHQVENVVAAVKESRQLARSEKAELDAAGKEMWARLPEDYQWLKDWRHV